MMVNKRKLRRGLVLVGLLVATGTGAGYVATDKSGNGIGGGISAASAAVRAALADPLSLFTDRSPGERAAGALTQTKGPRERVASPVRHRTPPPKPESPVERVLTSLRERPPIIADVPDVPFGQPLPDVQPPEIINPPGPPLIFPPPPPPPGPVPGCLDCAPPVNPPPVTPPGGVPEPATWAMLLIGFFSIGAAMRRRAGATTVAADR